MASDDAPIVSVVIPTYNRVGRLRTVLDALANQTFSTELFEVVVVSDGSTDGTDSYLETFATPYRLVNARQENAGPAAARNRGVAMARGQLVLFVDDDIVPERVLIERHLVAHGESPRRVVIGPMLSDPAFAYQPWIGWEQAMLYKQYDAMRRGRYAPTFRQFYTGNASIRRAFFNDAGGFDPTYRRAEDVELAYRLDALGAEFVFDESAAAYHHAERSYESWLGTATSYGRTDVIFARVNGQDWRMGSMVAEFARRNILTRLLIRTCLGRSRRTGAATRLLRAVVDAKRLHLLSSPALSALYSLAYYSAAAEEFGDVTSFREVVTGRRSVAEVAWHG